MVDRCVFGFPSDSADSTILYTRASNQLAIRLKHVFMKAFLKWWMSKKCGVLFFVFKPILPLSFL